MALNPNESGKIYFRDFSIPGKMKLCNPYLHAKAMTVYPVSHIFAFNKIHTLK